MGPGGAGWVGGNGRGGALDNGLNATATVINTTTRDDWASGGAAAVTGRGISEISIAPRGAVSADLLTAIVANFCSTEGDDVFGDPCRL